MGDVPGINLNVWRSLADVLLSRSPFPAIYMLIPAKPRIVFLGGEHSASRVRNHHRAERSLIDGTTLFRKLFLT